MTEKQSLRARLNEVVFGYDTRAGRVFDVVLIAAILLSVLAVMLDSVASIRMRYHDLLYGVEWFFTLLFTLEYALRLYITEDKRRYAFSFYGLVDLLSILPTYLAFFYTGATYLIVLRTLRILRVFRVLKLFRYMGEANLMVRALKNARHKILVFIVAVLSIHVIFGCVMYLVEGPESGFTSIPVSVYWSIVTMTTVGFGDIVPVTALGRTIAAIAMITGYSIIAVPTGIISSELMNELYQRDKRDAGPAAGPSKVECDVCGRQGHDQDARYCKQCGARLGAVVGDA